MQSAIRTHVAAALLLLPLAAATVAQPAQAQQRAVVAQPAIRSLTLNSSAGLAPGAVLRVQLVATPGAGAPNVTLGSSGVRVALREQGAGHYIGSHTIRRADRIDPMQLITARADYGRRTISQNFSYPGAFQALAMGGPAAAVPAPVIERLSVSPQGRIVPGRELRFRLVGAAGGDAWLDIPGVVNGIDLKETRRGVYEGRYTVRRRDDLGAFDRAVATLRAGGGRATARVDLPDARTPRDQRAPQVSQLTPANGGRVDERGRTLIQARLDDDRSGVDPASVRLHVDGLDVTDDARITQDEVSYRERLGQGQHRAELVVRDRAGNVSRTGWSFRVV